MKIPWSPRPGHIFLIDAETGLMEEVKLEESDAVKTFDDIEEKQDTQPTEETRK